MGMVKVTNIGARGYLGLSCGHQIKHGEFLVMPEEVLQQGDLNLVDAAWITIEEYIPEDEQSKAKKSTLKEINTITDEEKEDAKEDGIDITAARAEETGDTTADSVADMDSLEPHKERDNVVTMEKLQQDADAKASEEASDGDEPSEEMPGSDWKRNALLAYCVSNGIKLKGARSKPNILQQIAAANGVE